MADDADRRRGGEVTVRLGVVAGVTSIEPTTTVLFDSSSSNLADVESTAEAEMTRDRWCDRIRGPGALTSGSRTQRS